MQCKQLVTWLKDWFTPKDEDYHYSLTSAKIEYNINEMAIIRIDVIDGDGNPVPNHTFTLSYGGGTSNIWGSTTVTSDNTGSGYYTHTCSDWGTTNFNVEGYSHNINVSGLGQVQQRVWSSTINLTYTLYVDKTNRHCSLTITGSSISIASGSANYELTGWIPSEYRPKANKFTMLNRSQYFQFYAWNNGNIGISNFASTTQNGQGFSGEVDWNY